MVRSHSGQLYTLRLVYLDNIFFFRVIVKIHIFVYIFGIYIWDYNNKHYYSPKSQFTCGNLIINFKSWGFGTAPKIGSIIFLRICDIAIEHGINKFRKK